MKEVYADLGKRLGYYDLPAMSTATDTANSDMSRAIDLAQRVPLVLTTDTVYVLLETLDAWTPSANLPVTLVLVGDQN